MFVLWEIVAVLSPSLLCAAHKYAHTHAEALNLLQFLVTFENNN